MPRSASVSWQDDDRGLRTEAKSMNIFETLINLDLPCDICGEVLIPMYGVGWDNDRLMCGDRAECGAEYEFPTSTALEET